ncbi:MAG: ADP-ribosyltransferase [bacterium]|nr:ADP-ribosyltransferase [bacterium]
MILLPPPPRDKSDSSASADKLREELDSIKEDQGLIGKAWDGIKNLVGLGAGSNKAEKAIEQYEKGEISLEEAEEALTKYEDGQKMSVDVVGDMLSGIVAVGAAALAPFTGGASLLVAAGTGALVKVGVKGLDSVVGGRDYTIKDFGYDLITGSINGAMAPLTNALGGAAGTGVAKACGLNVAKAATKEVAEEAVEGAAKTAAKGFLSKLLAKGGAEYVAKEGAETGIKTILAKVAAYGTDMAIDGALSGATDGFARSLAEGDFENMGESVKQGFVGGLIAAPVIGGGFKIMGSAGAKVGNKLFNKGVSTVTEGMAEGMTGAGIIGGGAVIARTVSGETAEEVADGVTGGIIKEVSGETAEALTKETAEEIAESLTKETTGEVAEALTKETAEEIADISTKEAGEAVIDKSGDMTADVFVSSKGEKIPEIGGADVDIQGDIPDVKKVDAMQDVKSDAVEITPDAGIKKEGLYSTPEYRQGVEAKIKQLKSSYPTKTGEFTIDGKKVQFEIFKGTKSGSNSGSYVLNKETGELFYAKFGGSQSKTEALASKIYKMAGIDVPEVQTFTSYDGTQGLLSKFIPDLTPVSGADSGLNKGFAMDALLANWDAVCSDNAVTNGKDIVRIDVGGTFDFRAQGGKKSYTSMVDEITTLIDPKYNAKSASMFSTMTRDDLIASLKRVADIDDDALTALLEKEGMTQYKDVLLKRKEFLTDLLGHVEESSDTGMDMLSYLTKMKSKTFETSISNAQTIKDLADIQTSINHVKDYNTKKALQKQLDAKKIELNKIPVKVSGQVDSATFEILMNNAGFVKDNYTGKYSITLSDDYKDAIVNKYGPSSGSKIVSRIQSPLSSYDMTDLRKLMNVCDGKYAEYFSENMTELVAFYKVLRSGSDSVFHNFDKFTPAQWDAIMNTTKYKVPIDTVEALASYKGSSYYINSALTQMKKNPSYSPSGDTMKYIDSITSYIDTQAISQPMTVYRGEGYQVLESVKVGNKTLAQLMQEAAVGGDTSKITSLIDMVESGGNYVATQERFMSTSLLSNSSFHDALMWELEMPAGSKGVFLEGANITGSLNSEVEYLVQRGSKIRIKQMDYDYKKHRWHLKGELIN